MRTSRLAELLAGVFFLGVGLYSIRSVADLVGPGSARALLPGSLVYMIGGFLMVDFLMGSWLLSRLELRYRSLPVKVKLWRINVANPEALLLATPYLASAAASLVYLLASPLAPTPLFLAATIIMIVAGLVGGVLLLGALLEPPVSLTLSRESPKLVAAIPWYVRLSRLRVAGRKPLQVAGSLMARRLRLHKLGVLASTGRTRAETEALAGALVGLGTAMLPLAGVAYLLLGSTPALALLLAVPAPLAGYTLLLYYKVNTRRRLVDENLHWLSLAAALSWPLPIGHAVRMLARSMGGLGKEAGELDASIETRGPVEGLAAYAERHPSRELRLFATGLANVMASGGAVKEYLYDKARTLLEEYSARLERASREGLILAEVVLLVAGLGVLVLLAAALFVPSSSLVMLLVYSIPVLGVLVLLAGSRLPAVEHRVDDRRGLAWGLLAGSIALLASLGLGLEAWLGLGIVIIAGLAGYGLHYRRIAAIAAGEERGLEQWLRGVMEGMRSGRPLVEALGCNRGVAQARRREDLTCARVEEARRRLLAGGGFESRQAVSGLLRRVFALTQLLLDSGSASVRDVELLYRHVSEYMSVLRRAREAGRLVLLLAYAVPWLTAVLVEVLYSLALRYQVLVSGIGLQAGGVEPVYEASRIVIVASSLILGVMAARFYDYTYRNTLRVASVVASSLLALATAPLLAALLF
ncbi:MAG: type II secretion system F family protein [Desulfurococcales archaeon]|nr:type II secretion system F family protein [Desulfurococcales archaeon]